MENKKNNNGIAALLVVIFAIIGVACATVFVLKALKKRKVLGDEEAFDDLDDLCDLEDDPGEVLKGLGEEAADKLEDVKEAVSDAAEDIKEAVTD